MSLGYTVKVLIHRSISVKHSVCVCFDTSHALFCFFDLALHNAPFLPYSLYSFQDLKKTKKNKNIAFTLTTKFRVITVWLGTYIKKPGK